MGGARTKWMASHMNKKTQALSGMVGIALIGIAFVTLLVM